MRSTPYSSTLLIVPLVLTSTPPFVGFTFIVTLAGFIYGFPGGIPIVIIGAVTGAIVCFALIRWYNFARFLRFSPSKQQKYTAIQEAIEQGGIGMIILLRLSPIPWQFTNMLLALLPSIEGRTYVLVTVVASFKLSLEVWVGSQLADLSNPDLPPSAHRLTLYTMAGGCVILLAVAIWLYRLTMARVEMAAKHTFTERDIPDYEPISLA